VRRTRKKIEKVEGFTIVELLTVMSIIVILISILVPAMNTARRYAKEVQQKNQFKAINTGLEMYRNDLEEYPESSHSDSSTDPGTTFMYSGANKLAEAMMGQDLLGYHPYSRFRSDYKDGYDNLLYDWDPRSSQSSDDPDEYNQQLRKGPYVELGNANAYRMWNVYGNQVVAGAPQNLMGFNSHAFVLCDEYSRVQNNAPTGEAWIGMPILYYRADTSGNGHPHFANNDPSQGLAPNIPDPGLGNYYNYWDNQALVALKMPFAPLYAHLMDAQSLPTRHNAPMDTSNLYFFYHNTYNEDVPLTEGRPHRADSFILISAGFDGEYGTSDDIMNFPK
jgi:type II secretory pathway pseudopilin PulG